MLEKTLETSSGVIHYWINEINKQSRIALIFLPGLTADHRLFDKQIEYFKDKFRVLVWDAPGHASSYPFDLDFDLFDEAKWLYEILINEGIDQSINLNWTINGRLSRPDLCRTIF